MQGERALTQALKDSLGEGTDKGNDSYHICSLILLPSSSIVLILKSIPEKKKKKGTSLSAPFPKLCLRRVLPTCAGYSRHGLWWMALGMWDLRIPTTNLE